MRDKLKSRRGASMLMAMAFLLISMSIGTIILTAAAANAGHIRDSVNNQNDYLAVASAANMLKKEMGNLNFKGTYSRIDVMEKVTYTTESGAAKTDTTTSHSFRMGTPDPAEPTNPDKHKPFLTGGEFLKNYLDFKSTYIVSTPDYHDSLFPWGHVKAKKSDPITMEIKGDGMPTVYVEMTPYTDKASAATDKVDVYCVRAKLYTKKTLKDKSTKDIYVTSMEFRPVVNSTSDVEVKEKITESETGASMKRTTTTTYSTTVTWDEMNAEIRKGAAK